MKFEKNQPEGNHQEGYTLTVCTMEGDADDYHKFDIFCKTEEELAKYIIACEVVGKTYPNGRGGGDAYDGEYFEFLDKYEEWPYSTYCDAQDSYDGYELVYHDGYGNISLVTAILSDEDKSEIEEAPAQE